jgi:S1-C subfamily serine protease
MRIIGIEAISTTEASMTQVVFDVSAFINSRHVGAVQKTGAGHTSGFYRGSSASGKKQISLGVWFGKEAIMMRLLALACIGAMLGSGVVQGADFLKDDPDPASPSQFLRPSPYPPLFVPEQVPPKPLLTISEVVNKTKYSIAKVRVHSDEMDEIGTAFAIDGDGDLLTNCHVVEKMTKAKRLTVEFTSGTSSPARPPLKCNPADLRDAGVSGMVARAICQPPPRGEKSVVASAEIRGCDRLSDLAVLHMERNLGDWPPARLPEPLVFADPGSVQVGQEVITIGFALNIGGDPSVNRGIVSGLDRSVGSSSGLIQTDASINHGNSGGPMLNMRGEVIGVNTLTSSSVLKTEEGKIKLDEQGEVQVNTPYGIFYARGGATAEPFARMMVHYGHVVRADLGISSVRSFSVLVLPSGSVPYPNHPGAEIRGFATGSAAEKAGLRLSDVITGIFTCHGHVSTTRFMDKFPVKECDTPAHPIRDAGDLLNFMATIPPGENVILEVERHASEDFSHKKLPWTERYYAQFDTR